MSWFKLPMDRPDSLFNIQLQKYYNSLKNDNATLIPPDYDEMNEIDTDMVKLGVIPLIFDLADRGRPIKTDRVKVEQIRKRIPITKRQRQDVYKRCENYCEYCGEYTDYMEIHHRDGNPGNNLDKNLLGCCPNCHKKLDSDIHSIRAFLLGREKL